MARHGVWYPIVSDSAENLVILEVHRAHVAIPRKLLEIRRERPERFTVVYRSREDENPARGQANDLGRVYAVCPVEGSRVRLTDGQTMLECPNCGHRGQVAWWETG